MSELPPPDDGSDSPTSDADFTIEGAPEETAKEAISRLARLSPLAYEAARTAEATRLGFRASKLDQFVAEARGDDDTSSHRGIRLDEPSPWPEPVHVGEPLGDAVDAILRHVILSKSAAVLIALWSAHTFVYTQFQHTPRLAITSPVRRCGKSTLIDVLLAISCRTLKADSISAAAIYRTIEVLKHVTLLIDEADTFLKDNEEVRGVINSGGERSGQVIRVVEISGEHIPVAFPTFAPVVIASIGEPPATIADRSVPVKLQRKAAAEVVQKLRDDGNREALTDISRKFRRWADSVGTSLPKNPPIPPQLNDREGDIAVPLLAIADLAGGEWPARARHALIDVFGARETDGDNAETGALLLSDIRDIFDELHADSLASAYLCCLLTEKEERPWAEWRRGRPMTVNQLARALKPFKVHPETCDPVLCGDGLQFKKAKGYQRSKFEAAWSRYLKPTAPPAPATPPDDPDEVNL